MVSWWILIKNNNLRKGSGNATPFPFFIEGEIYMNELDKPVNINERYLYEINIRLNVIINMLSSIIETYANQNNIAVTNNVVEVKQTPRKKKN